MQQWVKEEMWNDSLPWLQRRKGGRDGEGERKAADRKVALGKSAKLSA